MSIPKGLQALGWLGLALVGVGLVLLTSSHIRKKGIKKGRLLEVSHKISEVGFLVFILVCLAGLADLDASGRVLPILFYVSAALWFVSLVLPELGQNKGEGQESDPDERETPDN